MAPADIQHTFQHVIAPVSPGSQQEQQQQDKHTQQVDLQLSVEQLQPADSVDDSWTPGQPQSSENDAGVADYEEETWDPNGPPPQYCTNCTARLYAQECSDCGHNSEQDSTLFEGSSGTSSAAAAITHASALQQHSKPLIIWDEDMLLHEEGKAVPHPERPDRLRAIMARLIGNQLTGQCHRIPARTATKQELLRVHTHEHLQRLQLFCSGIVPAVSIPSDTYINQHTLRCAALAAGSAAELACRVVQGEVSCGAAIIRPPGHHAESNTAMGFCFFNNAAVAARAAQAAGAERVLILDWDVHHGNGTQHIFESDPSVLYMSLHRYDRGTFYPGTGAAHEVGRGRGAGYTVNVPWDAGNIGNGDYMAAMQQVILPIAWEFAPNLIIISAGFDAADGDPIGGCCLTPECFGQMTADLMPIAPTVLLLEGGYNLLSTAVSTEACLRVLLGEQPPQIPARPTAFGWLAIQAAKKAHSRYWSCLAGAFPQLHHQSLQQQMRLGCCSRGKRGLEFEDEEFTDEYEEAEYQAKDDDDAGEEDMSEGYGDDDGVVMAQQQQSVSGAGQRQSHDGYTSYRHSRVSHSRASTAAGKASGDGEVVGRLVWHQQRRHASNSRHQRLDHMLRRGLSRKQQILRAIHRQAMRNFWRRRLQRCQHQSLDSQHQPG
jgi:histone deacetylase 6